MNADLLLARIAGVLQRHHLDVILTGNAAAALQGAPVSTVDFDLLFRKTPANLKKLKAIATELDAVILRPYYPVCSLFRIVRDEDGLQLDFMSVNDGIRSFEALKKRSLTLADIEWEPAPAEGTVSATSSPRLQRPKRSMTKPTRDEKLAALKKECDLALRDQIRRLLALPPERRTHFLRKRIGLRITAL